MKKTRYIPYGYSIRNGKTIIDHDEAKVIQKIFDSYVNGDSLKDIAESLTAQKIPYTERTNVWDKSRIARIIDNAKYIGDGEYDPIIDEHLYECAVAAKIARQRGGLLNESQGIATIRNRVRCADCGYPMERKLCQKARIKESWTCSNPLCGHRIRISDCAILEKINILINRIIANSDLMLPKPKEKYKDSAVISAYRQQIQNEISKDTPNEDCIVEDIIKIAEEMYKGVDIKNTVTAQIAKRRVEMMRNCDKFTPEYFNDLISHITLDSQGRITLHTKTETTITEGDADGS